MPHVCLGVCVSNFLSYFFSGVEGGFAVDEQKVQYCFLNTLYIAVHYDYRPTKTHTLSMCHMPQHFFLMLTRPNVRFTRLRQSGLLFLSNSLFSFISEHLIK